MLGVSGAKEEERSLAGNLNVCAWGGGGCKGADTRAWQVPERGCVNSHALHRTAGAYTTNSLAAERFSAKRDPAQ